MRGCKELGGGGGGRGGAGDSTKGLRKGQDFERVGYHSAIRTRKCGIS